MKILACYKLIPEEQDIIVNNDGSLNFTKAEPKISQFDLNAIEAAVGIQSVCNDAQIIALSAGGKTLENPKARKDVLSRGPGSLTQVIDETLHDALPYRTARVLAAAAGKLGFDVIVCGDGSGDLYAQQVGLLLGEYLGIPAINGVSKILSVTPDTLTVERTLEDEVEVLAIPLPAAICVSTDINDPPIPSMKAILSAAKKPVTVWNCADLGLDGIETLSEPVSVAAPKQKERLNIIIEGDGDEQIAAFADHLRKILN